MKTFYQNPDMEIVKFIAADVISTSTSGGMTDGGEGSGDEADFGDLFG